MAAKKETKKEAPVETVEAETAPVETEMTVAQLNEKYAELEAKGAELNEMLARLQYLYDKDNIEQNSDDKAVLEQQKAENAKNEEYVTIRTFKDSGKYKDDIFVQVNGQSCKIPRGTEQRVKRKFVKAIRDSEDQDFSASILIDEKADEFEAKSREL